MQTIQSKIIDTLETVKDHLEKNNEEVQHRNRVFAPALVEGQDENQAEGSEGKESSQSSSKAAPEIQANQMEKFKQVSFELLDIGLFYTGKGIQQVQSFPLYQKVDKAININDKFDLVKKHGENLYTLLDQKFRPLVSNVFFLFDSATARVTSFIKVITSKQQEISEYVEKTYSTVQVTASGTWMRLDFDHDGSVSVQDLKQSMVGLYEFLKNFDVIETTTNIKSQVYSQAIAYMQAELDQQKQIKSKEDHRDQDQAKVE